MAKVSDIEAESKIKAYMYKQNRPYSAIDILTNLHKQFGKPQLTKCLDTLVESGELKEKLFGKQKIYFPNQDNFPTYDDAKLQEIDAETKKLTEELKLVNEKNKKLESELRNVKSSLSTEELLTKEKQLTSELSTLSSKLANLQSGAVKFSKEEKVIIEKQYDHALKSYRKRKALANDMLNAVLENYPKKKKDLYEEIGIETDEDAKFTV